MTVATPTAIDQLPVDARFASAASTNALQRAAASLKAHGFDARVVATGAEAADIVLSLVPAGAEVHGGASETLRVIGVTEVLDGSGRFDALRPKIWSMDRATQGREMRKLGAAPDVFVNSAAAVTEDGKIVLASSSGSQLGPIASGAGKVILVVGAQKVVPDLATALDRVERYAFPLEDARAQGAYGMRSTINKLLILQGEYRGRVTVLLVGEAIGF